jgi:hypothetical protein
VAGDRQDGEQRDVRDHHAAEALPARVLRDLHDPGRHADVALQRELEALPARLPAEIAPDLPAETAPRDRERRREREVRIVGRPGLGVVAEMVVPVREHVEIDRVRAEPVPDDIVPAAVAQQDAMRGLVHEDREAELPAADHGDRE